MPCFIGRLLSRVSSDLAGAPCVVVCCKNSLLHWCFEAWLFRSFPLLTCSEDSASISTLVTDEGGCRSNYVSLCDSAKFESISRNNRHASLLRSVSCILRIFRQSDEPKTQNPENVNSSVAAKFGWPTSYQPCLISVAKDHHLL